MPDIWGSIGSEISHGGEGEWLYKTGGEIRGPVPLQVVAQKLVKGEIDLDTQVAREGGDFHPISRVAAFAAHITEAKKHAQKRAVSKGRRLIAVLALPALAGLGAAGYFVWEGVKSRRAEHARVAHDEAERKAAKLAKMKAMREPELVALVSFGNEDSVKIRAEGTGKKTVKRAPSSTAQQAPEELVQQCKLSQTEILGTLKRNLAKINVCVENERATDSQGLLPPALELEFVVQTSGKVTDFTINDRHYRKGPLNNCMLKVFNAMQFAASNGANCPVTIPIKIGK